MVSFWMENSSPSISSLTLRNWLSDRYGVKPYLNEAPAWSTWRVQRCRTGSFWDSSGTGTPRYLGMPGKCDGRRQTVTRPRLCPGWLSRTREPRASSKQRDACLSGNSWSGNTPWHAPCPTTMLSVQAWQICSQKPKQQKQEITQGFILE